jgi:hypothetical protein
MGVLRAVVARALLAVLHARQELLLRSTQGYGIKQK